MRDLRWAWIPETGSGRELPECAHDEACTLAPDEPGRMRVYGW